MKFILCIPSRRHRWRILISLPLAMFMLAACQAKHFASDGKVNEVASERHEIPAPIGTPIELMLTGYNYTNRYIDEFDVDAQGGGNLFVSEGANGGGKNVCCISYRSGAKARKVRIRWQSDACIFTSYTDGEGHKHERTYNYFNEVEVQVSSTIPRFPRYFEVHFYPDGHVEASITEHESRSRLVMKGDRENNWKYPRCPDDTEPKE